MKDAFNYTKMHQFYCNNITDSINPMYKHIVDSCC